MASHSRDKKSSQPLVSFDMFTSTSADYKQLYQDLSGAWKLIAQAHTITFLTHYRPDPDGISACAALSKICEKMGKTIESVYPTEAELVTRREPANVRINGHSKIPDLIIACDTAHYDRLYYPDVFKGIPLINIDHHISNAIQGAYNFVDHTAASTCELLYFMIMAWDKKLLTQEVAECLLYGILYDSQTFHTQSTTSQTLRVAADLVEKGASLFELKTELYAHRDPKVIHLWADFMKSITLSPQKHAAWAIIKQRDLQRYGLHISSLVGFNNFLAEISDIDVSILFYETPSGHTKVSLRSKKADVNKLAAQFGGGGHTHASGILSELPLDELVLQVINAL